MRIVLLAAAALALLAAPAGADDGVLARARRTTPRAVVSFDAREIDLGVPGGRAWGIESALRRAPDEPADLVVELSVRDAVVREAFVRVAWYERPEGRQRQIALSDSTYVRVGADQRLRLRLDPPEGATAYKVRVLARLERGAGRSSDDAVVVTRAAERGRGRPSLTRALAAPP